MIRIGLVDLDTSHARAWLPVLPRVRQDARVVAVTDAGAVRTGAQIDAFCRQHDCTRYDSVEELAHHVDAAMVLTADWNAHLGRAEPLLRAGVPTFVDKPLAGSVADLRRFVELAEETGTPLLAGSGYRYNAPVQAAAARHANDTIRNVFSMTPSDTFDPIFYAVHQAGVALGLLGPGIEAVRRVYDHPRGTLVWYRHARGTEGHMLINGPRMFRGVMFDAAGEQHVLHFTPDHLFEGVWRMFFKMIDAGASPLPPQDLIEPSLVMLAALHPSAATGELRIADLDPQAHQPSDTFARDYAAAASPATLLGDDHA